jgi:hypothetical protein
VLLCTGSCSNGLGTDSTLDYAIANQPGDPDAQYRLGALVTERSLRLGVPVHDRIVAGNSNNNARFWYIDVTNADVSFAPLEVYVSGMLPRHKHHNGSNSTLICIAQTVVDKSQSSRVLGRLTAIYSYCPMLSDITGDGVDTFLEFTEQGLISLTKFGPALLAGRWYEAQYRSL